MRLLMTVTDQFEEIEAIGTLALLRRAGLDVDFVSLYSDKAEGRYGVHVEKMIPLADVDLDAYDMIIIPGGPEYKAEEKDGHFLSVVRSFFEKGLYVAAICAGPTILGHLGLLKGKKYTCFTSMDEDFGGTYVDQYVVQDGKLITGRSCAASIDFALKIVEVLLGEKALKELKEKIYY